MKSFLAIFALLVLSHLVAPSESFARQDQQNAPDTLRKMQSGIYPLPILFYTPETGVAGGAAALYLYRDPALTRPSNITGDVIYTAKKQIILEFAGDQYFDQGQFRLLTSLTFKRFPDKFFGIGNNTAASDEESFTPRSFNVRAVLYRTIFSHFQVGPALRFETSAMKEVESTGQLAGGTIAGSTGGVSSALGIVANWDSRDNTFAASSGSFYQLTGLFYRSELGGDYNYTDLQIDARNFFELFPSQVLAIQYGGEFIDGTAPFQSLVQFGGQNILRGYYAGRYRDNNGVVLQGEYRIPVWWRFGIVGFAGVAQVADKIGHFALNRFWFAGGLGLRFYWNPDEKISLRLDYGVGNNSSGMYVTVTEAF